jgi:heme/copper-type cytochrome/quinol oxidase subunit 2
MVKKAIGLLLILLLVVVFFGTASQAWGADTNGEQRQDKTLRSILVIAGIWLATLIAVITVVIVIRKKAGDKDRESREG